MRYRKPLTDVIVTLLLWIYFTVGFVLFFALRDAAPFSPTTATGISARRS